MDGLQTPTRGSDDSNKETAAKNVNEMVRHLFGAPLVGSAGDFVDAEWHKHWLRVIDLSRKQYSIPGGSVGRDFVDLLAMEVDQLA